MLQPLACPLILAVLLACALPLSAAPVDLYVATNGNDAWSGTRPDRVANNGPFATLTHARDELRKLRAAGKLTEGATVHVRGGVYELAEPLALGAEDSGTEGHPIIYRAYRDEKPSLVGARRVTGLKPYRGNILQCDLKGTPLEGVAFRQLFFRGERMTLARYPNVDPEDPHFGTWAYVLSVDGPSVKDHFTCTDDVIKDWTRVDQAQVCIHPAYGWAWNTVPVKSADRETKTITLGSNVSYNLVVGDRYFVQNLFEELDAPGEWYLDRATSTLYFWPPAEVRPGDVLAPTLATLVQMKGAKDVLLRGFTLEACDDDAVQVFDCERCLIAQSTIRNCGGWGVTIAGGRASGARGNDISWTGAGGVSVNGGDRKTLTRGDNFADNNYIHHIACFQRTYNTGVNLNGCGNTASHNLIHDCYHQGILVGGNDQTVEYNTVHHTNLGSEDTGGLYVSSRDFTVRGTVIRYNVFHHLGGFGKASSWQPVKDGKVKFEYPHFTWGIYLDAPEVGCTVFGNVLYSVPVCGMFNHEGRDNTWENNIIVDAPAFQVSSGNYPDLDEQSYSYVKALREKGGYDLYLQHYPELATYTDDPATHHTCAPGKFVRNIISYTPEGGKMMRDRNQSAWGGGQLVWTFSGSASAFAGFRFDDNCIYAPEGLALKFSLTERPAAGRMLTWDEWRATGQDQRSQLDDPKFVDPAKHDFRLRPDSPAPKLGFQPIPFDRIGPYQDELRASWPIIEAPGAAALGDFTTERYFQLPGYEPAPAREFVPRKGAPNAFARLKAGQPLMIVVFAGGAHAQGGWRPAVADWLRQQYPAAKVTDMDASICGCVRGSAFSVYRFGHDVLAQKPDLVFIDFASDDSEGNTESIWSSIEGVVRRAWTANPSLDLVFVYSFRPGYEESYGQGLSPTPVSAYENLANHYGIPSINMGVRISEMAKRGELLIRARPEEAGGKPVFSNDGVYTTPAGWSVCAQVIAEHLAELATEGTPGPHTLVAPFRRANLEHAKQVPITQEMLSGDWQRIVPAKLGTRDFSRHFDEIWSTDQPGAKVTFRFRGTDASLFDLMGPATGRVKVTVDGQDAGTREQVDQWAHYYRLSALPLASSLDDTEHTITVELLPDPPNRSVPIEEAKKANQYRPEDFEGVKLYFGCIRIVGRN
ncbi:MAG: hypothetical protein FJX75_10600 [Armatimonadetes bacterium]|nr:hypothetical protein [Armatimonadota bacterium]